MTRKKINTVEIAKFDQNFSSPPYYVMKEGALDERKDDLGRQYRQYRERYSVHTHIKSSSFPSILNVLLFSAILFLEVYSELGGAWNNLLTPPLPSHSSTRTTQLAVQ
jgi:hypothetical protein